MTQNSAIRIEEFEDGNLETSRNPNHQKGGFRATFQLSSSQIKFPHPQALDKVTEVHRANLVKSFSHLRDLQVTQDTEKRVYERILHQGQQVSSDSAAMRQESRRSSATNYSNKNMQNGSSSRRTRTPASRREPQPAEGDSNMMKFRYQPPNFMQPSATSSFRQNNLGGGEQQDFSATHNESSYRRPPLVANKKNQQNDKKLKVIKRTDGLKGVRYDDEAPPVAQQQK